MVDGLDLAARYNAGSTGLVIGGDWYDVVVRPDGLVHLTVGDVAGRGIEAATLMGQIRNAFRAYALRAPVAGRGADAAPAARRRATTWRRP